MQKAPSLYTSATPVDAFKSVTRHLQIKTSTTDSAQRRTFRVLQAYIAFNRLQPQQTVAKRSVITLSIPLLRSPIASQPPPRFSSFYNFTTNYHGGTT